MEEYQIRLERSQNISDDGCRRALAEVYDYLLSLPEPGESGANVETEIETISTGEETIVYFIEGAGLVKIGMSQNPTRRLRALQSGSPVELTLLATTKGGYSLEAELHRLFAQYRVRGEWFSFTPEIEEYVNRCSQSA